MKKKILVTGGSGLVGSKLAELFSKRYDVFSCYLSHTPKKGNYKIVKLDIKNKEQTKQILNKIKPDIVIHSAAIANVDFCEKNHEEAWKTNVEGTRNIVEACKDIDAKLVHISTDYIFDGKNGPCSEEDKPNPINYYGKTKLEAEEIVKKSGLKYLIIRTTVVYGWDKNKLNFVTWSIKNLRKDEQIKAFTGQYGTPAYTNNIAEAILHIIDKEGVYNITGPDYMSRFEFANLIADVFGLDKGLIVPSKSVEVKQAPRPKKAGLKIEKLKKAGFNPPTTKECLEEMKKNEDKDV